MDKAVTEAAVIHAVVVAVQTVMVLVKILVAMGVMLLIQATLPIKEIICKKLRRWLNFGLEVLQNQ